MIFIFLKHHIWRTWPIKFLQSCHWFLDNSLTFYTTGDDVHILKSIILRVVFNVVMKLSVVRKQLLFLLKKIWFQKNIELMSMWFQEHMEQMNMRTSRNMIILCNWSYRKYCFTPRLHLCWTILLFKECEWNIL